jgi:hypothetical protein
LRLEEIGWLRREYARHARARAKRRNNVTGGNTSEEKYEPDQQEFNDRPCGFAVGDGDRVGEPCG